MRSIFYLVIFALVLTSSACSNLGSSSYTKPSPELTMTPDGAANPSALPNAVPQASRMPWEVWNSGQAPGGAPVRNFQIIAGDRFRDQGLLKAAADQYIAATKQALPAAELDNAFLRLASIDLLAGNYDQAVFMLSDYFKKKGTNVLGVSPSFALLFAYAYGAQADYEQSLAWFSQALRVASNNVNLKANAERGAAGLLATIEAANFPQVQQVWSHDLQIGRLVQAEVLRRSNGGVPMIVPIKGQFWLVPTAANVVPAQQIVPPVVSGAGVRVVALLPLTGTYQQLGLNVKRGLELALAAEQKDGIDLIFADTKEDPKLTNDTMRKELAKGGNVIFVGPILAPAATGAATLAQQIGATIITLTKSETFATSPTVLRLGPTASSQLSSLIDQVADKTGARKFGIAYPRSAVGEDLLEVFNRQLSQRQLALSYSRVYEPDDFSGFIQLAEELEGQEIDALFVADDLSAASRLSLSLSEATRRRIKLIGSARWDNQADLARYAQALDGIIFASGMKRATETPVAANFYEAYRKAYGLEPDFMAAQGFDLGTLLAATFAGKKLTMSVAQSLKQISSYDGITGVISVQPAGNFERRFSVVQFKGGQIVDLAPEKMIFKQVGEDRVDPIQ